MTVTIRIPEDLQPVTPRNGRQRAVSREGKLPPGPGPVNPRGRALQFLIDQLLIIGFTLATIFAYLWPCKSKAPLKGEKIPMPRTTYIY